MGSPDHEPGHDSSESPVHPVTIAKPFYLGKYEITQGQYQAIMNYNQAQLKGPPNQPVDSCGFEEAVKFCQYASQRTGRRFRLPTEAEWEYACRAGTGAGTQTAFSCGPTLSPDYAVAKFSPDLKPVSPGLAGSRKPNAFGLYDMHGSLWEWTSSPFTPDYNSAPTTQPDEITYVYRGGSFRSPPEECRSAIRFAGAPNLRNDVMGFRVVVEPR
jgi:formylglycine-generating enzyme required for sulfatase activity